MGNCRSHVQPGVIWTVCFIPSFDKGHNLIVKVLRLIIKAMAGAESMLKLKRPVQVAKPTGKPIDIDAGFQRAMERYPRIIARLGE